MNHFDLFVEVIFALRFFHLAFDAGLNRAINIELLDFNFDQVNHFQQSLMHRIGFKQILFIFDWQFHHVRQQIYQLSRIARAHRGVQQFRIRLLRQLQILLHQSGNARNQILGTAIIFSHDRSAADDSLQISIGLKNSHGAGAFTPFD